MTKVESAALDVIRHAKPPTEENMKDGLMIPARYGYALEVALIREGLWPEKEQSEEEQKDG